MSAALCGTDFRKGRLCMWHGSQDFGAQGRVKCFGVRAAQVVAEIAHGLHLLPAHRALRDVGANRSLPPPAGLLVQIRLQFRAYAVAGRRGRGGNSCVGRGRQTRRVRLSEFGAEFGSESEPEFKGEFKLSSVMDAPPSALRQREQAAPSPVRVIVRRWGRPRPFSPFRHCPPHTRSTDRAVAERP